MAVRKKTVTKKATPKKKTPEKFLYRVSVDDPGGVYYFTSLETLKAAINKTIEDDFDYSYDSDSISSWFDTDVLITNIETGKTLEFKFDPPEKPKWTLSEIEPTFMDKMNVNPKKL